jgi:hypothetical protein
MTYDPFGMKDDPNKVYVCPECGNETRDRYCGKCNTRLEPRKGEPITVQIKGRDDPVEPVTPSLDHPVLESFTGLPHSPLMPRMPGMAERPRLPEIPPISTTLPADTHVQISPTIPNLPSWMADLPENPTSEEIADRWVKAGLMPPEIAASWKRKAEIAVSQKRKS